MSVWRSETWIHPDGSRRAEITVEVHADGYEVVPVSYELFEQMVTDLGFTRGRSES